MPTGSQKLILVADDDTDIRQVVMTAVSVLGHHPMEAKDGTHAMALLESHWPALAILDVNMPGYTGIEICARIKGENRGDMTPVIMLTALDSIKDKVRALEGGADDYLTKPFHLHELQARIKGLLRVRELNLRLHSKNEELKAMQEKLVERERQLLLVQLAGTAAHSLGQPLSAIMLNCHLLETLPKTDERYQKALKAINQDVRRMAEMLEKLKTLDASRKADYYGSTDILDIKDEK